jgi:hypothetical protein
MEEIDRFFAIEKKTLSSIEHLPMPSHPVQELVLGHEPTTCASTFAGRNTTISSGQYEQARNNGVTRRRDPILAPNEPEFGSRWSLRRSPSTPRGRRLHHVVERGRHVSQGCGADGGGLQVAAVVGCRRQCGRRRWCAAGGGAGGGGGGLQAAARAAVVLLAVGFKSGCELVIRRGPG